MVSLQGFISRPCVNDFERLIVQHMSLQALSVHQDYHCYNQIEYSDCYPHRMCTQLASGLLHIWSLLLAAKFIATYSQHCSLMDVPSFVLPLHYCDAQVTGITDHVMPIYPEIPLATDITYPCSNQSHLLKSHDLNKPIRCKPLR